MPTQKKTTQILKEQLMSQHNLSPEQFRKACSTAGVEYKDEYSSAEAAQITQSPSAQPKRPTAQAPQQPAGELMTMDAMQQQITNASVKQIRELAHFGNQLSVKMHDAYARLGENIVGSAIDAGFVGIGEGVQRALAARNMDTIAPTSDPLSAFDDLDLTINTPKLPSGVSVQKMLGAG